MTTIPELDTTALHTAIRKTLQEAADGVTDGLGGDVEPLLTTQRKLLGLLAAVFNDAQSSTLAAPIVDAIRSAGHRQLLEEATALRDFITKSTGADKLDVETTLLILRFVGYVETPDPIATEPAQPLVERLAAQLADLVMRYQASRATAKAHVHTGEGQEWPPRAWQPFHQAVPDVKIDPTLRMQVLAQLIELNLISPAGVVQADLWAAVKAYAEAQVDVDGQSPRPSRTYSMILNGVGIRTTKATLTFDELVEQAFPDVNPERYEAYTVTYRSVNGQSGTMTRGQDMFVSDAVVNVAYTGGA